MTDLCPLCKSPMPSSLMGVALHLYADHKDEVIGTMVSVMEQLGSTTAVWKDGEGRDGGSKKTGEAAPEGDRGKG